MLKKFRFFLPRTNDTKSLASCSRCGYKVDLNLPYAKETGKGIFKTGKRKKNCVVSSKFNNSSEERKVVNHVIYCLNVFSL